jgi:hypothetical protein
MAYDDVIGSKSNILARKLTATDRAVVLWPDSGAGVLGFET